MGMYIMIGRKKTASQSIHEFSKSISYSATSQLVLMAVDE